MALVPNLVSVAGSALCVIKYIRTKYCFKIKTNKKDCLNGTVKCLRFSHPRGSRVLFIKRKRSSLSSGLAVFVFMGVDDRKNKLHIPSTGCWSDWWRLIRQTSAEFWPRSGGNGAETLAVGSVQCIPVVSRGGSWDSWGSWGFGGQLQFTSKTSS